MKKQYISKTAQLIACFPIWDKDDMLFGDYLMLIKEAEVMIHAKLYIELYKIGGNVYRKNYEKTI